eukprot:Nk52_evm1s2356 gene=Nk52_evmTU1s2356
MEEEKEKPEGIHQSGKASVSIAIQGCGHGDLDVVYDRLRKLQDQRGRQVDLLIICGDFQAVRNNNDLNYMHVPQKYRVLGDFHEYYNGKKKAPILTLFIGGNHEASNYLRQLYFGGWVAPNIFYLGHSGVVKFKGIRIAGVSGIYKAGDYRKGHYEDIPFGKDAIISSYHVREFELYKLSLIKQPFDIFLSHDWPTEAVYYGDVQNLLRCKKHFVNDVQTKTLGNPYLNDLLYLHKPKYWFAAHLHAYYTALIDHNLPLFEKSGLKEEKRVTSSLRREQQYTHFLALDKCISHKRQHMQIVDVEISSGESNEFLEYDPEWLSIIKGTRREMEFDRRNCSYQLRAAKGLEDISPGSEAPSFPDELQFVKEAFKDCGFKVENNFRVTAPSSPSVDNTTPFTNERCKFCDRKILENEF